MQKVAIIGAGAAGLCCARHFTGELENFLVHVFEKGDIVGGTWVYSHGADSTKSVHSSVYRNLRYIYSMQMVFLDPFPPFKSEKRGRYCSLCQFGNYVGKANHNSNKK